MAKASSLADLLSDLDRKQQEIRTLMDQVQGLIAKEKTKTAAHSKRIIKQGMSAFFNGVRKNPFTKDSDEADWWQYGFSLSRDSWEEMKA